MKYIQCILFFIFISSCTNTKHVVRDDNRFLITKFSKDKTYGYSQEKSIKVGGVSALNGPQNERMYLNALAGPNGEKINYYREGSCCATKSKNGFMGVALLDIYKVYWNNSEDTLSLYINMYDKGVMKVPVGLSVRL